MSWVIVAAMLASPVVEFQDAPVLDKTVLWDVSRVPAGQSVSVDSYCVDGETLKGMAGEKKRLVMERDSAQSDGWKLAVGGLVLGLILGGTATMLARGK